MEIPILIAVSLLLLAGVAWGIARIGTRVSRPETPSSATSPSVSSEQHREIDELLARGESIKAIKRLRETTGLGLSEAKHAIDQWQPLGTYAPNVQHPVANGVELSSTERAEIDKENEGSRRGKEQWAKSDNARIIAEDRLAAAKKVEAQNEGQAEKLAATLSVAKKDGEAAWAMKREVKAELEALPRLRRKAHDDGLAEGRAEARQEVEDRLAKVREREAEADRARRALATRERLVNEREQSREAEHAEWRAKYAAATPLAELVMKGESSKHGGTVFDEFQRRLAKMNRRRTQAQQMQDAEARRPQQGDHRRAMPPGS